MELFNVNTREREEINDSEALHNALLAGTHSYAAGSQVAGYDPDGQPVNIPAENVVDALQRGYRVNTANQNAVERYVNENKGYGGAAKVFLKQAVDEAAIGIPEMIFEATGDPLEVAKHEALKKEHEAANMLGGGAGFLGSLVVGSPLWKAGSVAGEKTAAVIAEKIMAKSAGEVSERTARSLARDFMAKSVAKGTGGAVEGAIVTAPIAITETMLGDPDAAAESLLAGIGIGGVFGTASGALSSSFGKLKETFKNSEKLKGLNTKSLARKAAKVLVGVPEDDIEHYIVNFDRVNAAPEAEAIKDMLDAGVEKFRVRFEDAKEQVARLRQEADESYRMAKQELAQRRAPEAMADDILGAMDETKAILGELSAQADDLLAASGQTFRKADLLDFMDEVGRSIGVQGEGKAKVLISDEANTAARKLYEQRQRIADGFGDDITAEQLRGILREVRKDINYNQFAGEFNDTLNQARKTFTSRISDVLKDRVSGYSGMMDEMAELAENLRLMSKNFGTKERAISSLNQAATAKGALKNEVLERFSQLSGRNYTGELEELRRAKELLAESRARDVREQLIPETLTRLKEAEAQLERAKAAYAPVKRLRGDKTQNIIRQQGFKNASIEDRRALEILSESEGQNFNELIRDRNALDNFSKESPNGSRRTLLGAVLGSMFGGGPISTALGGTAGATADVYGGEILKRLIDGNREVAGLLFVEQSMKHSAKNLDEMPEVLKRIAGGGTLLSGAAKKTKAAAEKGRLAAIPALVRLLGEDKAQAVSSAERSDLPRAMPIPPATPKAKQYKKLNDELGPLVSNPEALLERLAELTGPFTEGGAPMVGAALSARMAQTITYLHSIIPKPPRPRSPFGRAVEWMPGHHEMAVFEEKLSVVMDPFVVFDALEADTLTTNHMEALRTVYPALYESMRAKVYDVVVNGAEPIPYPKRVKLSLLMDAPMDASLEPTAAGYYQSSFTPQEQAAAGVDQDGGFSAELDMAGAAMTPGQKLLEG